MEAEPPILRQTRKGLEIRVRVNPNSSRESISYSESGGLAVKLKSPPVDGRANKELIRLISRILGIAPGKISLIRGGASREKTLLVEEVDEKDALDRFKAL